MPKGYTIVVENIFKNEDEEIRKQEFNKRWIELINRCERDKSRLLSK